MSGSWQMLLNGRTMTAYVRSRTDTLSVTPHHRLTDERLVSPAIYHHPMRNKTWLPNTDHTGLPCCTRRLDSPGYSCCADAPRRPQPPTQIYRRPGMRSAPPSKQKPAVTRLMS